MTHESASPPSPRASASVRKQLTNGDDPPPGMIRYFLFHPAEHTPRPLKFGTMRALRHWTIHRAWQLFRAQQRAARSRELERQYNSIRAACEALKLVADDGGEPSAEEDGGRLYRVALGKKDVGTFPIELRIPTDTPPKNGWNHGWKRA